MKTIKRESLVIVREQNGIKHEFPVGPNDYVETTEGEDKDSIEVSRNASGGYSWSIKEYYEPGKEAEVQATIKATADSLNLEYPAAKKEAK